MAVAQVDVPVFELCRGRQDVVGIVGGVGLEVLQYHGEQVFTGETLHHFAGVGCHRHWVAVVDDQGFDGRAEAR